MFCMNTNKVRNYPFDFDFICKNAQKCVFPQHFYKHFWFAAATLSVSKCLDKICVCKCLKLSENSILKYPLFHILYLSESNKRNNGTRKEK